MCGTILKMVCIILVIDVLQCDADCEFPWVHPGESAPCYAVSTDIVNYYNADKVTEDTMNLT